ncbi:MAG: 30S ribosomal protein S20 [Patescibacteria group bacterium]
MPNTQSAKKALRGSLKKRKFNLERKYKVRNSLKELRKMLASGSKDVNTSLGKAYSALDKAVKGKTIKKGKADRKKSRLSKMVQRVTKDESEK